MSDPVLFIVNPVSGSGWAQCHLPEFLIEVESLGVKTRVVQSERVAHAIELARAAPGEGFRRVVAVGGDGTVHEVINGLLTQTAVPAHQLTLGVVPVGTGNDFARSIGAPRGWRPALALALLGEGRPCDMGHVRCISAAGQVGRFFANIAGAGFDAAVIAGFGGRVDGRLAYLRGVLRTWGSWRNPLFEVRGGNGPIFDDAGLMALFALGRYFGGGMQLAPSARLDDGLGNVVIVRAMGGARLLLELPRVFSGRVEGSRSVLSGLEQVMDVGSLPACPVEADGELVGHTPARFSVVPRALSAVRGKH